MNRKTRKRLFIRSTNFMKKKLSDKWILENHKWPTKWKNTNPSILEDSWIIDMIRR